MIEGSSENIEISSGDSGVGSGLEKNLRGVGVG